MLFRWKRSALSARHGGAFWESHAQYDPLWAILSDPTKQGRRWDLNEFFETGSKEISVLLYRLAELGIPIARGHALDFGCGVGRLTQALASHFEHAVGVDISPTMVRLAAKLNRHGDRVRYVCNSREDLTVFDSDTFDLIYSDIVLQHVDPAATRHYIADFFRVLKKGGLLVFQLPSHPRPPSDAVRQATAMPADAYRARLIVKNPPTVVVPSSELTVTGTATNISSRPWSRSEYGQIQLGNHWLDRSGETMFVQDDGRVVLPAVLGPGETFEFALAMHTPAIAGRYHCEIDLVHELVCWFADRGSKTARFEVRVGEDDAQSPASAACTPSAVSRTILDFYEELPPQTKEPADPPMFSIHRDEVTKLVRAYGQLLQVDEDLKSGMAWVGYRYFVRK
jgi:SAM-dependent methyltransferase